MSAFLIGNAEEVPLTEMERFRVLAAALQLREFTSGSLAVESRLDAGVVDAVVRHRADLFPQSGTTASGDRREAVHWVVEQRARLELQEAADAIPLPEADAIPEVCLNLARSSLLQLVPVADPDERRQLLDAARSLLVAAEGAGDPQEWNELASRREHLETLVEIQDWIEHKPGLRSRPWFKPLHDAIEVVLRHGPATSLDLLRVVIAMPGLVRLVGDDFEEAEAPAAVHRLWDAFDALITIHMLPYSIAAASPSGSSSFRPAGESKTLPWPAARVSDATTSTPLRPSAADYGFENLLQGLVRGPNYDVEGRSGSILNAGLLRVRMSGPLIVIEPKEWDPFQLHGLRHSPEGVIEAFDVDLRSRIVVGAVVTSPRSPSMLIQYAELEWVSGRLTYRDRMLPPKVSLFEPPTGSVPLERYGSCTWTTAEHLQIRLDGGQSIAVLDAFAGLPNLEYPASKIGDVWLLDFAAASGQLVSAHLRTDAYLSMETVPFARLEYEPTRECFMMRAMPDTLVATGTAAPPEQTRPPYGGF